MRALVCVCACVCMRACVYLFRFITILIQRKKS